VTDNPLSEATLLQRETLMVLRASGWLYKEAAARLGVPEATVRTRIHQLLRRTRLPDRAEAAYWLGRLDG
jgi:DNA-binding NarL/FixJ family response regulator